MSFLIKMNKYPRQTIKAITGVSIETPTVVCVGNTMERVKIESLIKEHATVNITGKGKLTAIMEICDRLNLYYRICYNGKPTWEDAPLVDKDTLYIVRNPPKPLEGCVNLFDSTKLKCITLLPMSAKDIIEYERLKKMPPIQFPLPSEPPNDMQAVGLYLRNGGTMLPKYYDMWLLRNLYTSPQVLELLLISTKVSDKEFKKALLDLVKVRKPIALKYPIWVKMK